MGDSKKIDCFNICGSRIHLTNILRCLVRCTKINNEIIHGPQRSSGQPPTTDKIENIQKNILGKISRLLSYTCKEQRMPLFKIYKSSEIDYSYISNVLDDMLSRLFDRSNFYFDAECGYVVKNNPVPKQIKTVSKALMNSHILKIEKPQLKFKHIIPNNDEPYRPMLTSKPNALIPLDEFESPNPTGTRETNDSSKFHPYHYEISEFKPSLIELEYCDKINVPTLEETKYTFVNTKSSLMEMMSILSESKEIGFDLENHNQCSYLGFTCLIQISTRNEDFIVDAIELHDELTVLNEVFTDPKILKVAHAADSDIIWLQRDYNVFVVNLFDTFIASSILHYPKRSLCFLIKNSFDVSTDKSYQMADWRLRPLTEQMLVYARIDSHYLLPLYDFLKNQLYDISKSTVYVKQVFERSKSNCLKFYTKPDPVKDIKKNSTHFGHNEFKNKLYLKVFQWRDKISRKIDESPNRVINQHALSSLIRYSSSQTFEQFINMLKKRVRISDEDAFDLLKSMISDLFNCDNRWRISNHTDTHHKPLSKFKKNRGFNVAEPISKLDTYPTSKESDLNPPKKLEPSLTCIRVTDRGLNSHHKFKSSSGIETVLSGRVVHSSNNAMNSTIPTNFGDHVEENNDGKIPNESLIKTMEMQSERRKRKRNKKRAKMPNKNLFDP